MDKITVEQRDAIKKTTSDRLRARLEQAGWSADAIDSLDRDQLMNAVAELFVVPTAEAALEVPITRTLDPTAKELERREREIALREREMFEQRERWEAEKLEQRLARVCHVTI